MLILIRTTMEFASAGSLLGGVEVKMEQQSVQYVYDDTGDPGNVTELMLEDGTRAMLVNGTLVTAEGQALVLQDGTDLSQYSVDDNADEIIIRNNHENFLQIVPGDTVLDQNLIGFTQSDDTVAQQVLYVQDGENLVPIQEPIQVAELNLQGNDHVLDGIGGLIDLEQLLLSQPSPVSLNHNYQYAIIKDGKLHLQGVLDDQNIFMEQDYFDPPDYVDLSGIKGRNVKTGQVITLSKQRDKALNQRLKYGGDVYRPSKRVDKAEISNISSLRKLVNKKITIGQTAQGKTLVGKIVKVMKREAPPAGDSSRMPGKSKRPVEKVGNLDNVTERSEKAQIHPSPASTIAPPKTSRSDATPPEPTESDVSKPPKKSKLIVHKKLVSKDCFDVISRTMIGLMNMDSVVRKLRNKTVIVKIIEKTYDQHTEQYAKSISYCSGYMVREYKLDEAGGFSEAWKFIPDLNAKDTILGPVDYEPGIKRTTNMTIQITVNPEGNRTTRVIINPPDLFQCKTCSARFRTTALLKVHSLSCRFDEKLKPESDPSTDLPKMDYSSPATKNLLDVEDILPPVKGTDAPRGMYECTECNEFFHAPVHIRKHMKTMHYWAQCSDWDLNFDSTRELDQHNALVHVKSCSDDRKPPEKKVTGCHICGRQFSRYSNLQRHIEIHKGEDAKYQCSICSCSYHYISSLTRHVVSCHVDKSKKIQHASTAEEKMDFSQLDRIVEMVPLENMSEDSLQRYVEEYVEQEFRTPEDAVHILQVPIETG